MRPHRLRTVSGYMQAPPLHVDDTVIGSEDPPRDFTFVLVQLGVLKTRGA